MEEWVNIPILGFVSRSRDGVVTGVPADGMAG